MFPRSINTPLQTEVADEPRPQRMDRSRNSRIEKAREFIRRELADMQLPSSCASAPQVDTERCALTFAPENEDPDQIGANRTWRKTALRRREVDSPVCILCISNLPKGKTKKFYESFLQNYTTDLDEVEESSDLDQDRLSQGHLGPIFPQYGSVFLSFWSKKAAFLSFRLLQEEMPDLRLDILPNINTNGVKEHYPLLIFVNAKSGGGQGKKVLEELRYYFSRYQVFELNEGGPLPGLFAYRLVARFRVLVCGGDGTVGWVLQCLEDLHKYLRFKRPPISILPLGTGNDLSRVLGWGGGYSGGELVPIFQAISNAHEVALDRWNVLFDAYRKCSNCQTSQSTDGAIGKEFMSDDKNSSLSGSEMGSSAEVEIYQRMERVRFERQQTILHENLSQYNASNSDPNSTESPTSTNGVNAHPTLSGPNYDSMELVVQPQCDECRLQGVKLVTMSNYLGIGLDAEISQYFHESRERNPEQFRSRVYNKTIYAKAILSKIPCKSRYINNVITLRTDTEQITLPNIQGLIFTNIASWGAGADIWKVSPGSDKDSKWKAQNTADGMLEVVGITGLTHFANIATGLRSGIRLAQASYFRLNLLSALSIQVDGEPWEQPAGEMIISPGGVTATMLKKAKKQKPTKV